MSTQKVRGNTKKARDAKLKIDGTLQSTACISLLILFTIDC